MFASRCDDAAAKKMSLCWPPGFPGVGQNNPDSNNSRDYDSPSLHKMDTRTASCAPRVLVRVLVWLVLVRVLVSKEPALVGRILFASARLHPLQVLLYVS